MKKIKLESPVKSEADEKYSEWKQNECLKILQEAEEIHKDAKMMRLLRPKLKVKIDSLASLRNRIKEVNEEDSQLE